MEARLVGTPSGWTYELKINSRWLVIHTGPAHLDIPVWNTPVEAQNAAARKNAPKLLTWRAHTIKAYIASYAVQS